MILEDYFDRVYLLTLEPEGKKASQVLEDLEKLSLSENPIIWKGIDGDELPPPEGWTSGGGAWGCLSSHIAILQDIWKSGKNYGVVLEDDVIWQPEANRMIRELVKDCQDWFQLYLGGQLMKPPTPWIGTEKACRPWSVNRTHAYVVRRQAIPVILPWIQDFQAYFKYCLHVDHRMEEGQKKCRWGLAAPSFWIAGQREGYSWIRRTNDPERWWHWPWNDSHKKLPLIYADDEEAVKRNEKKLHFGFSMDPETGFDEGLLEGVGNQEKTKNSVNIIGSEAYGMQRYPAVKEIHEGYQSFMDRCWEGPILGVSQAEKEGWFTRDWIREHPVYHPWLNPG